MALAASFCLSLGAQTLAHREFSIKDGLPQSQVDAFHFDSRGYLWVATRGGVSCFNGESIRTYRQPGKLAGLKIFSLAEDSSGNLYVLNQNGILRFDGVDFEMVIKISQRGRSIKVDAQNRLWFTTSRTSNTQPSFKVYDINNQFQEIRPAVIQNEHFINSNEQFFLIEHPDGHMIMGNNGIHNWKILYPGDSIPKSASLEECIQYYIESYSNTPSEGQVTFDIDSFFHHPTEDDSLHLVYMLMSLPEEHFQHSNNEMLFFNKYSNQLYKYNYSSNSWNTYQLNLKEPFYRHYRDSFQRILAGLETGFIQVFQPFILEYDYDVLRICWNITDLPNGDILFANHNDQLIVHSRDSFQIFNNVCLAERTTFYPGNHTLRDGRMLLCSNEGVNTINEKLECIHNYKNDTNRLRSITSQHLTVNKQETFLLAAIYGGLDKYTISPEEITPHRRIEFQHPSLQEVYSNAVLIDHRGNYWVGHEKGLSIYHPEEDRWEDFSIQLDNFPAGDVATIYKDHYDMFWLGTAQGLVYGSREDGFELIEDPLLYGVVNCIDSFDRDHLILGGTFGICILNIDSLHQDQQIRGKIFNHSNGFMAGEPAENTIYRMHDGSLMIGTQSYPVQLFPEKMDLRVRPLKTRILSVNEQLLPFRYPDSTLQLPYSSNEVRIEFEAIGMYRPGPTRYAYKINQNEWSPWQREPYVELNELGSGTHSFSVKTLTPGISPAKHNVSTLSFSTSVPLWMEPYFAEVLGGLLIATLLFTGILAYINYRQRRRNREHALAIDYLRIQSLQAQMNPHFVFNVLGTLQNMVLKADTQSANRQLVNLSTLIRRFLESTVQSNLEEGQSTIKEQSLEQEIELLELYIQFEQLQTEDLFDYHITVDPALQTGNYKVPPMLIQPFVENAIKHGLMYKEEKGELKINFSKENNHLLCLIEDNGVGRKRAKEIQGKSLRIYRSYGTKLVEDRIHLLNKMKFEIDYFIEDLEEGGTRVTIKIEL